MFYKDVYKMLAARDFEKELGGQITKEASKQCLSFVKRCPALQSQFNNSLDNLDSYLPKALAYSIDRDFNCLLAGIMFAIGASGVSSVRMHHAWQLILAGHGYGNRSA